MKNDWTKQLTSTTLRESFERKFDTPVTEKCIIGFINTYTGEQHNKPCWERDGLINIKPYLLIPKKAEPLKDIDLQIHIMAHILYHGYTGGTNAIRNNREFETHNGQLLDNKTETAYANYINKCRSQHAAHPLVTNPPL